MLLLRKAVIFKIGVLFVLMMGALMFFSYQKKLYYTDKSMSALVMSSSNMKAEVSYQGEVNNTFYEKVEPGETVFVFVVCEASKGEVIQTTDIKAKASKTLVRQLKQVEVVLKSALLFTTDKIHFIVVTNTVDVYLKILNIIKDWPSHYTSKLRMTRRQSWHPPGTKDMMMTFRPCTVEILFLHKVLSDVDAAVYVDTDTFFLRSPTVLHSHLKNMNQKHIAGFTPCFYYYGTKDFDLDFGYYGQSGINAGVMLMNFTRMNALPFDLTSDYVSIYRKYGSQLRLMDQDILNHFFSQHPDLLYELDCSWNLRHGVCEQNPFPCESAKTGISLIHGPDVVFFRDFAGSVKALFETFLNFDIRKDDPMTIPQRLETALNDVLFHGNKTMCGNVKGFAQMVTHYPRLHLSNKGSSNPS